jgi:hypothetical protein
MGTPGGVGQDFSMSANNSSATITIYSYQLDPVSNAPTNLEQVASGQSIIATVTSSNTSVGTISQSPVLISAGNSSASTTFVPGAFGTTVITATATGYGSVSQNATVTESNLVVSDGITVGQFMEEQGVLLVPGGAPTGGLNGEPDRGRIEEYHHQRPGRLILRQLLHLRHGHIRDRGVYRDGIRIRFRNCYFDQPGSVRYRDNRARHHQP